jgi:hypothetical protein
MTNITLTSEEYAKLYTVYVCATNLVEHKNEFDSEELNEWHKESKVHGLKEAVNNFKNSI